MVVKNLNYRNEMAFHETFKQRYFNKNPSSRHHIMSDSVDLK